MTSLRPENASDWHPRKRRLGPRSSSGKPKSWSRARASPRPRRDRSSSGNAKAYCGRISSYSSTTPIWPGAPSATCWRTRSVSRARRWPTRWRARSTGLARQGSCAGPTARRGSTALRTAARSTNSSTMPPACAERWRRRRRRTWWQTFVRLAAGADIDAVELEELRQLAQELSGAGLRAINAMLKAAQKQHAAQQAQGRAGAACCAAAGSASADPFAISR